MQWRVQSKLSAPRLLSWALLGILAPAAAGATATGTQSLQLSLGAIGKILIATPNVELTRAGRIFENFTAPVTILYEIRTTGTTGTGFITTQAAAELAPGNGPRIGSGDLTYTCGGATSGTACTGKQTRVLKATS